jgi:type IV secretion system protein VirB9
VNRIGASSLLLGTVLSGPAIAAQAVHQKPYEPQPCDENPRMLCIDYKSEMPVHVKLAPGATFRVLVGEDEHMMFVLPSDERTLAREVPEKPGTGVMNAVLGQPQPTSEQQPTQANPNDKDNVCDLNLCTSLTKSVDGSNEEHDNALYIRPRKPLMPQPLAFSTKWCDGAGKCHAVHYELEVEANWSNDYYYGLKFAYPKRKAEEAARARAEKIAAWRAQLARRLADPPAPPTPTRPGPSDNVHYGGCGAHEFDPNFTWDNGRSTYLRFEGNRPVPKVAGIAPSGEDMAVPAAYKPDAAGTTIVVGTTAKWLRLRYDTVVTCVHNLGQDPEGRTAPTMAAVQR